VYQVVSEPFDIASDQHLVGMDVKSQLSINGARVADLMIDAMPDAVLFRTTLRVVKHWAKRRGIYSNIHGYLGGFSWALLTSYVCLSNVRCRTAPEMVVAFFRTFAFWNWAQDPVCLVSPTVDHPLRLPDWRLNHHPASMTVLTPAYPNNNSTFNVRPMTAETIVSELKRAHEFLAPCALTNHAGFVDLLATVCIPSAFFKSYRSFIEVHMTAQNESDLKTW
jgi:poly(A) polymerase